MKKGFACPSCSLEAKDDPNGSRNALHSFSYLDKVGSDQLLRQVAQKVVLSSYSILVASC